MDSLWIIDRDSRRRAALYRLAGAPDPVVIGAPGDPAFDAAPAPVAVLLGVGGDLESELQLVHRTRARLPDTHWILVAERDVLEAARALFDTLAADFLAYPPESRLLRRLLARLPDAGSGPLPLSQRPARDALSDRFTRWFSDLELPDLLRALDPGLADVPLLVTGEPGSGRGLLARYVHHFGGTGDGDLVRAVCGESTRPGDLADALAAGCRGPRARRACTIWLDDVDRLPRATQRQVEGWIRFAPPAGAVRSARVRWVGTAEGELEPGLRHALAGLTVPIPPLRERPGLIARFADATALEWCARRGEPARRFGDDALAVLDEYPWPGNLAELEGVVVETLVTSRGDPIAADDLQYEGVAFAPLEATAVGTLVDDEGEELDLEPLPPYADPDSAESIARFEWAPDPVPDPHAAPRAVPPAGPAPADDDASLRRLVGALAHEVRNPLSTIRTFAELLPERYDDPDFRGRFAELVGGDVQRIEDVVERLRQLASLSTPERDSVDVAALLEQLLDERRVTIQERRLVVLKELHSGQSYARGDAEQLRLAFEALLGKSLQLVPARGSVYLASQFHPTGLRGEPAVRVLVRFQGPRAEPAGEPVAGVSVAENSLEFALAEAVVRAHDGALAIDAADGGETVIVLDLPAPGRAA